MHNRPLAYFITFTTYGSWLHGDSRTSIIRSHGVSKHMGPAPKLSMWERQTLKQPPLAMNAGQRQIVLQAIIEHCIFKEWHLIAAHVRSNHVHVIVRTTSKSDLVSAGLKSWSTRALRRAGHDLQRIWTRGASCIYIFTETVLRQKIHYVLDEQGDVMQCYHGDTPSST